jgi:2-polyprenyl-6-methoxyphenol hydroxylase-like FAD-dependent oxidoreductase
MTEIGVDITYATAVVEMPPDATTEWKLVLTLPDPPYLALHAIMVPTEDGRWITAIADHSASAWIETWDAFLEASRSLITPTVHNALRYAQPPEGIRHYRFPVSTWKHFERLPRLPRGVLPVADAFCRFNPIHGQGMSSAAKQALLLQDVLDRAAADSDPIAAVQAGFMAEVPRCSRRPGSCRRAPTSSSHRRAANAPTISPKRASSRLPSSAPPSPIPSFIAR